MSRLTQRFLSALILSALLTLGLGACTELEEQSAPHVTYEAPSTFDVHPTLIMEGAHQVKNVVVTRAFLGIGSLLLEPLDDLDAPVISNRHPVALSFSLAQDGDHALDLPALSLVTPGRYLVTIAIEPQVDDPLSTIYANIDRKSVEIEGVYGHDPRPCVMHRGRHVEEDIAGFHARRSAILATFDDCLPLTISSNPLSHADSRAR